MSTTVGNRISKTVIFWFDEFCMGKRMRYRRDNACVVSTTGALSTTVRKRISKTVIFWFDEFVWANAFGTVETTHALSLRGALSTTVRNRISNTVIFWFDEICMDKRIRYRRDNACVVSTAGALSLHRVRCPLPKFQNNLIDALRIFKV